MDIVREARSRVIWMPRNRVAISLPCALACVMEQVVGRVGVGTGSLEGGCELALTRVVSLTSLTVLGKASICWLAGDCCSPSGSKGKGMRTAMVGCTNLTLRSTEAVFLPGQYMRWACVLSMSKPTQRPSMARASGIELGTGSAVDPDALSTLAHAHSP